MTTKPTEAERAKAAIQEMREAARASAKPAAAKAAAEKPTAKALLLNFRRGRHTQRTNQFLLEVPGIDSRAAASKLAGKRVVWTTSGGKRISGHIAGAHGNKGVMRARFVKGLPPQAIGKRAEVY